MKLIDILARELKVWPQGVDAVEQSDLDCSLFEYGRGIIGGVKTHAEDSRTAKVTRAQWQAAVDALKVESAPAWVGIGLPPVGTVCEINHPDLGWTRCEIVAHKFMDCGGNTHAIAWINGNTLDQSQGLRFRQIRTPEQITAEERSNAVTLMREIVTHEHLKGLGLTLHLEALYDAGCRFQEAK